MLRILAESDPDIAAVERRGVQAHPDLARTRFRVGDLFDAELLGSANLVEDDGFHRSNSLLVWVIQAGKTGSSATLAASSANRRKVSSASATFKRSRA